MPRRAVWLPPALTALAVQCVALYGPPAGPDLDAPPGIDKVSHAVMFAVPAALLVLAGVARRLVVPLLVVQALVSEVVQGVAIPGRSGDPFDALANLVGLGLGLLATRRVTASAGPPARAPDRASGPSGPPASGRARR